MFSSVADGGVAGFPFSVRCGDCDNLANISPRLLKRILDTIFAFAGRPRYGVLVAAAALLQLP